MNEKQLQKLFENWAAGELKAVDEACEKQLKHTEGKATDGFRFFAKAVCVEAIRLDVRNIY